MAGFLTDDWLTEAAGVLGGLDPVGEVDATLQYVVSGAPDGKVQVAVTVEGGKVTGVQTGKVEDPDLTITLAYDEALAILAGDTTADASFMRGAVKVEGSHAVWLLDLRDLRSVALPALADLLD